MRIPNIAFQPKLSAINEEVQSQGVFTISTGGAAKLVRVPPTEMFTKRSPIVA